MKRTYKLQNLECANCAHKMECDIQGLEGVNSAKINFMAGKLVVDADSDDLDALLDKAQRICSEYEKDCTIVR